jgi:pyruvate dehydrogenase E1 component
MIPFYIFYSMFGLQRTGDQIWAFGDARGRGFLLGATAGRTTLNGEGLQHEDGHSHLLASAVPNLLAYDPAFAYELATIIKEGLRRMYEKGEDIFYYITLYNQDYSMPPKPEGVDEGILKGLYLYRRSDNKHKIKAHVFGSGPLMLQALRAQEMLAEKWGVAADVWSMTSAQQLRNDAIAVGRWNRLHPTEKPRAPYLAQALAGAEGPIVATSDWVKAVNDMPARWITNRFWALGTDGFGRSDTREALRRHFEIDAEHIVASTLYALSLDGKVKPETVAQAIAEYQLDPEGIDPREA